MTTSTPPQTSPQGQQAPQPAQPQQQGLPPTGLQQQLTSMRNMYQQARTARIGGLNAGVDVNAGAAQRQQALPATQQPDRAPGMAQGSTSLNDLARRLAQSYGLAVGRDDLVDQQGNFNFTPDQIAGSSGGSETLGTAAAKMNYIASAVQREQQRQQMQKSEAALQSGLGLTGQRRSGSMIEQQQQFYMGLANLYQQQDYEAADFSFWIQKEKQDLELAMQERARRDAKKKSRGQFLGGLLTAAAGVALTATGVGAVVGVGMIAQGAGTAAGSSGSTGWF